MAKHTEITKKIDSLIAEKIKLDRMTNHLTQGKLANLIGVTVQQVQKYEKGINRISLGRLALIAKALNRPVEYFYTEIDINELKTDIEMVETPHQKLTKEIIKNSYSLKDLRHKQLVNDLILNLLKYAR